MLEILLLAYNKGQSFPIYYTGVRLYTVSKVLDCIGIIKLIPILVSIWPNTFNYTYHDDINKHWAILTNEF